MANTSDVLELIADIEAGEQTLEPTEPPAAIWHGNVIYRSSEGWIVVVFNDCGLWSYLASIEAPDRTVFQRERLPVSMQTYQPTDLSTWHWTNDGPPIRAVHRPEQWPNRR